MLKPRTKKNSSFLKKRRQERLNLSQASSDGAESYTKVPSLNLSSNNLNVNFIEDHDMTHSERIISCNDINTDRSNVSIENTCRTLKIPDIQSDNLNDDESKHIIIQEKPSKNNHIKAIIVLTTIGVIISGLIYLKKRKNDFIC